MKVLPKIFLLMLTAPLLFACTDKKQSNSDDQYANMEPIKLTYPAIYDDYLNRDVRDDIFYFLLPDRFYNGDTDNDSGSVNGAISQGGYLVNDINGFHGGDIKGVEEKLDYLKSLGISAIWMTPLLRNKVTQFGEHAYQGNWILDFTQIDPHLGTNQDLKDLIDAAHDRGMKIFFDIVTNHTADVIRYRECHNADGSFKDENVCPYKSLMQIADGNKYTPLVPRGSENLKVPAWLNDPKYYNNQGDTTWRDNDSWQGESTVKGDLAGLDDLNTKDPEVIAGMMTIYKNIISEFKPDGFRIKAIKNVDLVFWSLFNPAILKHATQQGIPNFHIFGEVDSSEPLELSRYTTHAKLPSVSDVAFQNAVTNVFLRSQSPFQISQLFESDDAYNNHNNQADRLMNFLGNSHQGRVGYFIHQSTPAASEEEKLQRSILSHAFMYLSRGIPSVYYGDEQGFVGFGPNGGATEDMLASQVREYNELDLLGINATTKDENFNQNHPIYRALQQLAQLRMDQPTLRRGYTFPRYFEKNQQAFAISRVNKQDSVEFLLAFNPSSEPQTIQIEAISDGGNSGYQNIAGDNAFSVNDKMLSITLAPLSYSVLKANTSIKKTELLPLDFLGFELQGHAVRFDYRLSEQIKTPLPLFEVTTEIKNPQGQYEIVAHDNTPPYSAVMDKKLFDRYAVKEIKVTISDWQGASLEQTFSLQKSESSSQSTISIKIPK